MKDSDSVHRLAWRLGRRLYCWARGDGANDPRRNGEYWLLEQMVRDYSGLRLLLDVGANVGEWSDHALACAKVAAADARVIAFEPCSTTHQLLANRFSSEPRIETCQFALSSYIGDAKFFSSGGSSGTNSLNPISGAATETVRVMTLDDFLTRRGIETVTMLKIDTEGFDLGVLRGAQSTLQLGKIEVVQFEYNWRWLLNKASLLDVFELIEGTPYQFGKLVGNSIVFFDAWHFELDRYFENNYVLIRRGSTLEKSGHRAWFDASNVATTNGEKL